MNDDLVQGERGFGMHPHRDVEIVTYIVDGILTHADSMGTSESLGRGSVQFMTAGTGISHSEHNLEPAPLRFVQIWITPRRVGLKPRYGGYDGTTASAKAARTNALCQVVGDADNAAHAAVPVRIAQDCSMYVAEARATARSAASPAPPSIPKVPLRYSAEPTAAPIARSPQLEPSAHVEIKLGAGRQAYLLCVEGGLRLSGADAPLSLARHDAAEIRGAGALTLAAPADTSAHLLLLEMAEGAGGRAAGKWPMHLG
jgi:redox-sensitive bicupin YhaK (pirin superfamily)